MSIEQGWCVYDLGFCLTIEHNRQGSFLREWNFEMNLLLFLDTRNCWLTTNGKTIILRKKCAVMATSNDSKTLIHDHILLIAYIFALCP